MHWPGIGWGRDCRVDLGEHLRKLANRPRLTVPEYRFQLRWIGERRTVVLDGLDLGHQTSISRNGRGHRGFSLINRRDRPDGLLPEVVDG